MANMGMVQLSGKTYRIVHHSRALYGVVKVADNLELGTFRWGPPLELVECFGDLLELGEVARAAIRAAKTHFRPPQLERAWARIRRASSRLTISAFS